MATGTFDQVFDRIKTASEDSKIAVFLTDTPGLYKHVFDAALMTQHEKRSPLFVGSFDRTNSKYELTVAIRRLESGRRAA